MHTHMVCTYAYMHAHIHTYVHTYAHAYTCAHTHTCGREGFQAHFKNQHNNIIYWLEYCDGTAVQ